MLKDEKENELALALIWSLMDAEEEGDRLELLKILVRYVEEFENAHYHIKELQG